MERIRHHDVAETIGVALDLIPPLVRERVGPVHHFEGDLQLAGCFPMFTRKQWVEECLHGNDDHEGREAAVRAMCGPMRHGLRATRVTTISYLSRSMMRPASVLHEFGHAIQYWAKWGSSTERRPDFARWDLMPEIAGGWNNRPHIDGAESWAEQTAEAFVAWLLPPTLYRSAVRSDHNYAPWRFTFFDDPHPTGRQHDNRRLLAFFNELAGWPVDTPPPSLR